MTIQIAVCDKEPLHLRHAAELLGREFSDRQAEIRCFLSPQALLAAVSAGSYTPSLAVILWEPGRNTVPSRGMRAIRELNRLAPCCCILFLTGHIGGWEGEYQYLARKKQRETQLTDALKQALRVREKPSRPTSLAARRGGKTTAIPLADILYVERCGRKCLVVTTAGEHIASQRPEDFLLDAKDAFVHCHQGYWVNLARISAQAHNEFILDNGGSIPISRTCRRQALARFLAYIKE